MSPLQSNINALVSSMVHMGLKNVIICPGSRNAPLVMAFSRNVHLKCFSFVDERSAAFVALGMAKQLREPVAVCCTSGSAALNFYPAIAEALYMQIPLVLITADRPEELIDRWDGQAIHQKEVFSSHVKRSFHTDYETEKEFFNAGAQAFHTSKDGVQGPVHINVPLREPLYLDANTDFEYPLYELPVFNTSANYNKSDFGLSHELANYKKVMILNGASYPDSVLRNLLLQLGVEKKVVVLSDLISGQHAVSNPQNWEALLLTLDEQQKKLLVPDLLISTGKMILSKQFKKLLKEYKPKQHWHIEENGYCQDTFDTDPKIIQISPREFFSDLLNDANFENDRDYFNDWDSLFETDINSAQNTVAESTFNEFSAVRKVLRTQGEHLILHAANSMSVRLLAYSSDLLKPEWEIYCNRGVSGIDGCTSTALGMALQNTQANLLITGDLAFLYDINAFLSRYRPENFKVVILNNGGGGIFMNIDGPSSMPEAAEFLLTPHPLNAEHLAAHYSLNYFKASNHNELDRALEAFNHSKGISLLEIFTDINTNSNIFKQYKSIKL